MPSAESVPLNCERGTQPRHPPPQKIPNTAKFFGKGVSVVWIAATTGVVTMTTTVATGRQVPVDWIVLQWLGVQLWENVDVNVVQ